jgi:hypothetical protein
MSNQRTYSLTGLAKFVLRHNLTGCYFVQGLGFRASLDKASRISESDMTEFEIAIRYTWGANFSVVQIGN